MFTSSSTPSSSKTMPLLLSALLGGQLLLLLLWTPPTAAAVAAVGRSHHHRHGLQCERITVAACQGLGYNMTAMPNQIGHADQSEAAKMIAELQPLLDAGCSKHARFLVCATLFPLCTPDVSRPVVACRSLCATVRADCGAHIAAAWPAFLECETFPQPERQELCMQVPHQASAAVADGVDEDDDDDDEDDVDEVDEHDAGDDATTNDDAKVAVDATTTTSTTTTGERHNVQLLSNAISHHRVVDDMPSSLSSLSSGSIWPWMSHTAASSLNGGGGGGGGGSGAGSISGISVNGNSVHNGMGSIIGTSLIPPIMSPVICAANFTPVSVQRCGPLPGTDALFTPQQKRIAGAWTLSLAALCFVLTLFSLVTFWAEPMRFGYPERPVLFLALCYNLLSVAYLERAIFHQQQVQQLLMLHQPQQQHQHGGGGGDGQLQQQQHVGDGLVTAAVGGSAAGFMGSIGAGGGLTCPASFMLVGYLQLAAAAWWFLFAVCWYLSTARLWSPEALERRSTVLHVLAWFPAAVPPMVAVMWDAVRPDELTGMCTAAGFVEVPAAVLLLGGAMLIVAASRSLGGMRRKRRQRRRCEGAGGDEDFGGVAGNVVVGSCAEDEVAAFVFQKRLTQVRQRMVVFSGVFFVPALAAVGLAFVETGYVTIEACVLGDPCVAPKRWPAWPTLLRLFVTLAGGSLAGMWVWSKKTCESYRTRMQTAVIASAATEPHRRVVPTMGTTMSGTYHAQVRPTTADGTAAHLLRPNGIADGDVANEAGGASAYLVTPARTHKYHHRHYQRSGGSGGPIVIAASTASAKKTPLPLTATVTRTTTMAPHSSVGPLYAGINFHNVPVYSVRPPTNAAHVRAH